MDRYGLWFLAAVGGRPRTIEQYSSPGRGGRQRMTVEVVVLFRVVFFLQVAISE